MPDQDQKPVTRSERMKNEILDHGASEAVNATNQVLSALSDLALKFALTKIDGAKEKLDTPKSEISSKELAGSNSPNKALPYKSEFNEPRIGADYYRKLDDKKKQMYDLGRKYENLAVLHALRSLDFPIAEIHLILRLADEECDIQSIKNEISEVHTVINQTLELLADCDNDNLSIPANRFLINDEGMNLVKLKRQLRGAKRTLSNDDPLKKALNDLDTLI